MAKAEHNAKQAIAGSTVKVDYKGTFDDGTVFDSSEGKEPLSFQLGTGQVIKGFDDAVQGMKEGDKKTVSIPSAEAYGGGDERLLQKVPSSTFPKEAGIKPGIVLRLQAPTGQILMAKVVEIAPDFVTLDFNHPLAGKNLNFEIKLVAAE